MRLRRLAILVPLLLGAVVSSAHAQELSPAERQAAAEAAYDRGTRAYRGGDYPEAARWWERANEFAPAAAAALQAVRAHQRAGNFLRAATLVAYVESEYGEEHTRRFQRPLTRARAEGFALTIACEECEVELDGEREPYRLFYLPPDVTHTVVATFETGSVEEQAMGGAGESQELALTAPEPEPELEPVRAPDPLQPSPRDQRAPEPEPRGISPAFFLTGLGLTAAAGAVASWSWYDTLQAADDYNDQPTQEKLDAGRQLELRTTILVITTGVLGAATLITLFFTNWSGGGDDDDDAESASLTNFGATVLPEGGVAVGAGGRF